MSLFIISNEMPFGVTFVHFFAQFFAIKSCRKMLFQNVCVNFLRRKEVFLLALALILYLKIIFHYKRGNSILKWYVSARKELELGTLSFGQQSVLSITKQVMHIFLASMDDFSFKYFYKYIVESDRHKIINGFSMFSGYKIFLKLFYSLSKCILRWVQRHP